MADPIDTGAITAEGITLAAFPAIESAFNTIINYDLAYERYALHERDVGSFLNTILFATGISATSTADIGSMNEPNKPYSITRASTATHFDAAGVLRTVVANELRLDHDPVTLEARGALIEGASKNLLFYSSKPHLWNNVGTAVTTPNTSIAPDGTLTGSTVFASSVDNRVYQYVTTTGNADYAAGVWLKSNGNGNRVAIFWEDFGGTYDGKQVFATLTSAWQRFPLFKRTFAGNINGGISLFGAEGTTSFDVWNSQIEVGSVLTSDIITGAAAVPRAADTVSIANGGLWGNELTVVMEFSFPSLPTSNWPGLFRFIDTANPSTKFGVWFDHSSHRLNLLVRNNGIDVAGISSAPITAGQTVRLAARFANANFGLSVNGAATIRLASGFLPATDRSDLAIYDASPPAVHICEFVVQRRTVTDLELQAMASAPLTPETLAESVISVDFLTSVYMKMAVGISVTSNADIGAFGTNAAMALGISATSSTDIGAFGTSTSIDVGISAMSSTDIGAFGTSVAMAVGIAATSTKDIGSFGTSASLKNTYYRDDGMIELPVWPFEPNWESPVGETLEWLTDILRSQTGAEQRRCLRLSPRRTLEFEMILARQERSFFDQMLMTHGSRDFYLPMWQDVHMLSGATVIGSRFIPCDTAIGRFAVGDVAFIGNTAFDGNIALVESVDEEGITTNYPLSFAWPAFSRLHPVKRARLVEQPASSRLSDTTVTAIARFTVVEPNAEKANPSVLGTIYRGFPVFDFEPESSDDLEYGYERMTEELDNLTSIPVRGDTANMTFPKQSFAWILSGRQEHDQFRDLIYALKGRLTAVWLPTYFADFEMIKDTPAGESYLIVGNIGFTRLGGARTGRQDIVINLVDGSSLYRRITTSTVDAAGNEIIAVDGAFPDGLVADDVLRISFMALSRLDQDNVEIAHETDTAGVARTAVTFRSAPDLRRVEAGF